jgi:hypothetical protein
MITSISWISFSLVNVLMHFQIYLLATATIAVQKFEEDFDRV